MVPNDSDPQPVAELEFDLVDVFAEEPFAGNQLAVVHGAAGLPDAALTAITGEFNLSETAFPTPVDACRYQVRIFTPGGEIPFAGHPILGTAWVLRQAGLLAGSGRREVVAQCGAGEIGVRFDGPDRVELSAAPRDLAGPVPTPDALVLLDRIGLDATDLAGEAWVAGAGLDFVYLPVRPEAVSQAQPADMTLQWAAMASLRDPMGGINVYAVTSLDPVVIRSRVFVPDLSVPEDPATGSAAAGLGMVLVARSMLPDGGSYRVSQGQELGRPSLLVGKVEVRDGSVVQVRVAGRVQPVGHGRIRVP